MRWDRSAGLFVGWGVLVAACSGSTPAVEGETLELDPETLPAGRCDTDGTSTSGTTEPCDTESEPDASATGGETTGSAECQGESDCGDGHCVAGFDPETLMRTEATCEFACVDTLNDAKWCLDDAGCCDPAARCTGRGYCIVESDEEDTEGEAGSTGSTSGGASSTTE